MSGGQSRTHRPVRYGRPKTRREWRQPQDRLPKANQQPVGPSGRRIGLLEMIVGNTLAGAGIGWSILSLCGVHMNYWAMMVSSAVASTGWVIALYANSNDG